MAKPQPLRSESWTLQQRILLTQQLQQQRLRIFRQVKVLWVGSPLVSHPLQEKNKQARNSLLLIRLSLQQQRYQRSKNPQTTISSSRLYLTQRQTMNHLPKILLHLTRFRRSSSWGHLVASWAFIGRMVSLLSRGTGRSALR